ncbi:MAG: TonB-dependent receptor plug domain-containing protein, partial [Bacteroidaceae bacterium]
MKKNQLYILGFVLATLHSMSIVSAQEIGKVNLGLSRIDSTQVCAVSTVQGKILESYPDNNLSNSLQGQLSGLVVRSTTNGLGNNSSSLYVRGMSRNDDGQAMVIVDGMERSMDDLIPEEVATVTVLKDAAAKILYGARAANGVIVVTTKRGHL